MAKRLELLPDTGHLLMEEQMERFASFLLDFFSRAEGDADKSSDSAVKAQGTQRSLTRTKPARVIGLRWMANFCTSLVYL